MKYLLFLLSTFAVAFGCSSQARQAENASNADSAVVADVADSEYTDISKLRITPIGRYRSYYTMFYRVLGATTTGNMAYTLTMKDSVANCDESSFCYTMANLHGPNSSYGNRYEVYKKNAEGWGRMPFKDGFTDLGYELPTGKSAEMEFSSNKFATPLKNGTYKLCKKVHFNINPHFKLTSDSIVPTATGSMCGAFECRVLSSRSDSIRMIVINHTQNTCRLSGLPSILDAKTQNRHPLTRSGTTKAYEWMQANGQIMPGEGILLVIPTSWNLKDISDAYKRSYYESGRLSEGVYSVSTLMEIELEAEFRLK